MKNQINLTFIKITPFRFWKKKNTLKIKILSINFERIFFCTYFIGIFVRKKYKLWDL